MRRSGSFFAKEIKSRPVDGPVGKPKQTFEEEVVHGFASRSERDGWAAEDPYEWTMNGRRAVSSKAARDEAAILNPDSVLFHFDVVARFNRERRLDYLVSPPGKKSQITAIFGLDSDQKPCYNMRTNWI